MEAERVKAVMLTGFCRYMMLRERREDHDAKEQTTVSGGVPPSPPPARALDAGLYLRRVRRGDFLTIKNVLSPDRWSGIMPRVCSNSVVQICGATRFRI